MKHLLASVILATAAIAMAQSPAQSSAGQVTVIRAGTLIDGKSDTPRHNQVIVIRGNRIESVWRCRQREDPARRHRHRSLQSDRPARPDRFPHAHFSAGRRSSPRRLRRQHPESAPSRAAGARATVAARRALEQGFTTLRDVETEGAGYGDVGIKQAIEGGYIPGTASARRDSRDLDHRRLSAGRLRAGTRDAEGRADY